MRQFLMVLFLLVSFFTKAQTPKLVLPEGNTSPVTIHVFSPDGTMLLTAGADARVCLWNVATGQLVATLTSEYGTRTAGFLKNGQSFYSIDNSYRLQIRDLVSGDTRLIDFSKTSTWPSINEQAHQYAVQEGEETLVLYSLTDQQRLFSFQQKFSRYNFNTFTPDGRYLVAASGDSAVYFWDLQTGKLAYRVPALAYFFTLSRDGKRLFTFNGDEGEVWDVTTGQRLCRLGGFERFEYDADFSPDGSQLVTNHYKISVVWDAATGKELHTNAHGQINKDVVFTPDGKSVISSFNNFSSLLWDAGTGKSLATLDSSAGELGAANFSKDGLFAAGGMAVTKLWDLPALKVKRVLRGRISAVREALLTRDTKKAVVTTVDGQVQVWDIEKGKLLHNRKGPAATSPVIILSPDNATALFYRTDSAVQVFDLAKGIIKGVLEPKGSGTPYIVFSPNGKRAAIMRTADSTLGVWDVMLQKLLYRTWLKQDWSAVAFSPDERFMAVTYADSIVQVRDAATGKLLVRLPHITEPVFQLGFTADGSKLLASGNYGNVEVFAANGWKHLRTMRMGSTPSSFELSPDGKKVLLYNGERQVAAVDINTGEQLYQLNDDVFRGAWSYFSADSKRLYLMRSENSVNEYDSETGRLLRTIEQPGYYLYQFHPQGGLMVGMSNGEISLVRMADGKPLYSFFGFDGEEYLVLDEKRRFDGSDAAKKLLYMTCGTEIIALEQVKDLLYVPHLGERIMQGETINSVGIDSLAICRQVPLVSAPIVTDSSYVYTVTPQEGGLGEITVVVNNIEVQRMKKETLPQQNGSYVVRVEKRFVQGFFTTGERNEVRLKAYTASNNLYARGIPKTEEPATVDRTPPNLFAVFIGVSDYKGESLDLGFAAKDADDLGRVFGAAAQKLLNNKPEEEHVFLYRLNTDSNRSGFPDKNTIKKTFEEIGSKAGPNDILLVFFAGHGVMQGQEQQFYFLTADAGPQQTEDEIRQTGISSAELMDWIQPLKVKAQKRILIFDACNSGQALKDFVTIGDANQQFTAARNDAEGKRIKVIEKLNERSGFFIYSASASSQSAYEYAPFKQGLLTYSLLKTIKENPSVLEGGQFLDLSKWLNTSKDLLEVLVQQLKRKQDPQLNSSATIHIGVVDEEVRKQIKLPEELPLFGRSEFKNRMMRVDNLNLRKTMDALLSTTREVLFDKQYEGDDVYSLSGDYTISNGIIKVTVLLLKGGTTIVEEFSKTGSINDLNALCRAVMAKVMKRKL